MPTNWDVSEFAHIAMLRSYRNRECRSMYIHIKYIHRAIKYEIFNRIEIVREPLSIARKIAELAI